MTLSLTPALSLRLIKASSYQREEAWFKQSEMCRQLINVISPAEKELPDVQQLEILFVDSSNLTVAFSCVPHPTVSDEIGSHLHNLALFEPNVSTTIFMYRRTILGFLYFLTPSRSADLCPVRVDPI